MAEPTRGLMSSFAACILDYFIRSPIPFAGDANEILAPHLYSYRDIKGKPGALSSGSPARAVIARVGAGYNSFSLYRRRCRRVPIAPVSVKE
jgi:hypothetical protein